LTLVSCAWHYAETLLFTSPLMVPRATLWLRWRSVFNGCAEEHKEIQFRNRSNDTVSFNWTAWSDNGKGSDGSSIALQPNDISDMHSFQLKGDITSVSTTHK
jgi:hypothetical protein